MNNKKTLAFYPLTKEITPIIRIENNITKEYNSINLYTEKSWGYVNKELGFVDGGDSLGQVIKDIQLIDDFDALLIPRYPNQFSEINNKVFKLIESSLSQNKTVYDLSNYYNDHFNKYADYVSPVKLCSQKQNSCSISNSQDDIIRKPIPIVLVCGLVDDTNMLTLQLELRRQLLYDCVKVSQIGSFDYCELLGFHSFPDFMYNHQYGIPYTINLFKEYVDSLIVSESPDILVVGIPGGIMPYNKYMNNEYGYLAYMVSSALKVSYAYVCIPYMEEQFFTNEYFELLDNILYYRFAIKNKTYFISNVAKQSNPSQKDRIFDVLIDRNTFLLTGDYRNKKQLSNISILSYFYGLDQLSSKIENLFHIER